MNEEIKDIWEKSILNNSSPVDLLGDIDGVVMGRYMSLNKNKKKGKKVSELLKEYYLQENNCDLISKRISLFAKEIGLGERFENEEAFIKKYANQVIDAGYLFNAAEILKMEKRLAGNENERYDYPAKENPLMTEKCGKYIIKLFIQSLKNI